MGFDRGGVRGGAGRSEVGGGEVLAAWQLDCSELQNVILCVALQV